ncbi:MAG: murein L,D-transpeptidase catalytic domain family protein [Bdellovibrionota bacterium]
MTLKHTLSMLILLVSPITIFAHTSASAEETSREVVLPKAVQDQLDFRKNIPHTLNDTITDEDKAQSSANYDYVDPTRVIPAKLREAALAYFDLNKQNFANQKYLTIVDFSAHSSKSRFFLVDMTTGKVTPFRTSHGKGSDSNNDGYAERFSNVSGSEASSLGYYRVAETYNGKHGLSIRLDGLSSTNSKARARAVVVHSASYVSEEKKKAGRSWGCFVLDPKYHSSVVSKIKNGSLLYAHLSK